jgi:RHS repeat-associated protein
VRFTGKERESNGLDYFGARYYDSTRTQRWMSPDPLTARIYDPLSLNKYTYVRNDPVNRIDPDGRLMAAAWFFSIDWPEEGPPTVIWTYYPERGGSYGGGGGDNSTGGGPPALRSETIAAITRAANAVKDKNGECYRFLDFVIKGLSHLSYDMTDSSGNLLTPETLVGLLTQPNTKIVDNAARPSNHMFARAWTEKGNIYLSTDAYTSYLYATLIHESFHLKGPETTKFHNDMLQLMYKFQRGSRPLYDMEERTGLIAKHCGRK